MHVYMIYISIVNIFLFRLVPLLDNFLFVWMVYNVLKNEMGRFVPKVYRTFLKY